ncbi:MULTISPECIES: alpha/beta fold hydrolase [unclassified Saccharicrinis]|uniref:alpha/beta fold hydrolase n=1 Tax=unclassified Saccharicrinis TaxID=2646859 RepID=UPI003D32D029
MVNLVENSVLLDSHKLVYYQTGKGTPILFIHGISTYSFIWRKIVPYFKDEFRVIVVDLLGCGKSDLNTDISFGIANQARFMFMLMDKLGLGKFHLVAHDVGGGIAQVMSANNPSALLSVSLLNTVAYDFWPVQPIISMRTPVIRQLAVATLDMGTLKLMVKKGLFHKEVLDSELFNLFRLQYKTKQGRKAFMHFAGCLDNTDLLMISDTLHRLNTHFMILRGEKDAYLGASITEKLAKNLKHSECVVIPTAGHYMQEDEPGLIANALLDFIHRHEE